MSALSNRFKPSADVDRPVAPALARLAPASAPSLPVEGSGRSLESGGWRAERVPAERPHARSSFPWLGLQSPQDIAQAETVWASVGSLAEELGPSAVAELVDDFALQTPELITGLESMIGVPACQTSLRRSAHSLKGSSSIFGLAGVERASFQLERSALEQDLGGQPVLIAELTRQFLQTLPILNAVRHRLLAEGD